MMTLGGSPIAGGERLFMIIFTVDASVRCFSPVAVPPMFENTTSAIRIGFGSRLRT